MNKKYGYVRYGAVVPEIKVANVTNNVDEIIKQIKLLEYHGHFCSYLINISTFFHDILAFEFNSSTSWNFKQIHTS